MFCTKCGAQVDPGSTFCTKCGQRLDTSNPVKPKAGGPSALVIASCVIAVAIIVAALFITGILPPSSGNPSGSVIEQRSTAGNTGSAAGAGTSDSAGTSGGESGSSQTPAATESSPQASAAATAQSSVDLSNPETYKRLNMFLSNFSEVDFAETDAVHYDYSVDVATASPETLAVFAVKHVSVNSKDELESAGKDNPGWGLPPDNLSGGGGGLRSWRLPASRVDELCNRYFERSVDFDALTIDKQPGWVVYQDGYVFFGTTNGPSQSDGVALAKQATTQADGTIRVEFDVYGMMYDASNENLYSATPETIGNYLDEGQRQGGMPHKTGVAVIRQGEYNDYTGGYVLVSYESQKV